MAQPNIVNVKICSAHEECLLRAIAIMLMRLAHNINYINR